MKTLLLIPLTFLLAGCGDVVHNYDLAVAQKEAEKHGGIQRITVCYGIWHNVHCNDGTMFKVYDGKLRGIE